MTPDQHTIREALRELDHLRVGVSEIERLMKARDLLWSLLPQPVTEHEWPDFVDGDMPR